MTENATIQAEQSKTTENYGVYDAPDVGDQSLVGTYIALEAAEQLGEFAEFEVAESDGSLDLTLDKTTGNYGVYSDEAEAVETTYISHEVLAEITEQDASDEEYEAPEEIGMTARPSDEGAFEGAAEESDEAREEAADALVEGDSDEDTASTEEAAEDLVEGDDEEVEISDEEVGLAE